MGAQTGLQNVTNETTTSGKIINSENGGNDTGLPAYPTVNVGNAWIPWADNGNQLQEHYLEVQTGKETKYVFQSGNNIWVADTADQNGFNNRKSIFPKVGVSVNLTIESDGTITMAQA